MFWYLGQDQDLGHTLKSSEWVCVYWPKSMNVRWLQKMKGDSIWVWFSSGGQIRNVWCSSRNKVKNGSLTELELKLESNWHIKYYQPRLCSPVQYFLTTFNLLFRIPHTIGKWICTLKPLRVIWCGEITMDTSNMVICGKPQSCSFKHWITSMSFWWWQYDLANQLEIYFCEI